MCNVHRWIGVHSAFQAQIEVIRSDNGFLLVSNISITQDNHWTGLDLPNLNLTSIFQQYYVCYSGVGVDMS